EEPSRKTSAAIFAALTHRLFQQHLRDPVIAVEKMLRDARTAGMRELHRGVAACDESQQRAVASKPAPFILTMR
ncbi:hypothetical protein MB818_21835, partial [Ruegeria sp. 1NDH52C]